jgi:hypothetical protein
MACGFDSLDQNEIRGPTYGRREDSPCVSFSRHVFHSCGSICPVQQIVPIVPKTVANVWLSGRGILVVCLMSSLYKVLGQVEVMVAMQVGSGISRRVGSTRRARRVRKAMNRWEEITSVQHSPTIKIRRGVELESRWPRGWPAKIYVGGRDGAMVRDRWMPAETG